MGNVVVGLLVFDLLLRSLMEVKQHQSHCLFSFYSFCSYLFSFFARVFVPLVAPLYSVS